MTGVGFDVTRETLVTAEHLTTLPTSPLLSPPVVVSHVTGVLHEVVENSSALTADKPTPCMLPVVQEHGQFPAQLQAAKPTHVLDVDRHLHVVLRFKMIPKPGL